MTEISRGGALIVDGSPVLFRDGWGGEDELLAPVQQCLWDTSGFLPTEELPWDLTSGCNMGQVRPMEEEEANSEEKQWQVGQTQGFYMELIS